MLTAAVHQSSAMVLTINVVALLLACIAAASAVPANFPRGKTVVYKYYGDVKAGIIEPAPYASQFALEGTLHVKHDTSDPTLTNAYYVVLSDVKTGMHNGIAAHYQRTKVLTPINDDARIIQDPFMIVYDENGKLQGVKIPTNEAGWSKNMKMAMASMLQLDLPKMKLDESSKPLSFISKENTIHGDCYITYDVHAKDQFNPNTNEIIVTKFSSPKNCTGFLIHEFDHVDDDGCQTKREEPVNVASRRLVEIEKQGENILIKKLVAHGGSNYFPWNARSEAHYALTNSTFALEKVVPIDEITLPTVNFQDVPMIRDLTYQKPKNVYASNAAIDITQGRHVIDQQITMMKLKKMLDEAADYLEENHIEMKEPDFKHGQTVNRILHTMGYLNMESLEEVFDFYKNLKTPKATTIQNIFLEMIPHVGTPASCLLTLRMIGSHKISDLKAYNMLSKLPLNVRIPNEELLTQMEGLVRFGDSIHIEVRKASILCFSSLVYRTFKNVPNPENNPRLQGYLTHFFALLRNEPNYEMKIVYLMALKNIEVGKIYEVLAPIIRGDLTISENPINIRLLAIWAIDKAIEKDYHYAHDLLWPIMADKSLPVKLRIAAYDILMHQAQTMTDVLHMYWFMVYESNEHLYNYHHTTLKGIANSVDPCKLNLRELARKIMRFTRVHETIRYARASAYIYDWKDEKYNHAEKHRIGMILNELTGTPEVLQFEHVITDGRKPVTNLAVRLHVQGYEKMIDQLIPNHGSLSNTNVLEVLRRAANDVPKNKKDFLLDVVVMMRGRVIHSNHYNAQSLNHIPEFVERFIKQLTKPGNHRVVTNTQHVIYENLYQMQVTSDMGLPVVFESQIPLMTSLKINFNSDEEKKNLEFDGKIWKHGDYSISIYNPMANVWHGIRRTSSMDVSLPIHASFVYNAETNNLKINFPRLPATKFSVGGVKTHVKDCVTVNEDDMGALKKSCATCDHHEVVTLGESKKKNYQKSIDSKDTGLQYSTAIFDCESGVTPVTFMEEWYRALTSNRKNDWNNWIVRAIMATRQQIKNILISPEMGSCGRLFKIEPSIVHPTSRVDLGMRISYEDVDHRNPSLNAFGSEKYNVRGTIDVIAAATNTSARSWDLNFNVDVNQGHMMNIAKLQLTRKTPGETNLKICVDAQKSYSALPVDPLKLGITKDETNSKLTFAVGRTNEEQCVRDDTLITIIAKGSVSDEQKKQFTRDVANGACSNDIKNPLYANPKNIIPKTLNCVDEVIRYTTLRKYTINVSHNKVPQEVSSMILHYEDILLSQLLPNFEYTIDHVEPGNIKIKLDYKVEKDVVDISIATPDRSFDLIDVDFEKSRFNGFGPVVKPVWQFPLDNTRFGILSLYTYTRDELKLCSIYPQTVLTGDGKSILYNVPEQWTLISGDHVTRTFAVFAKMIGTNMALKVYVGSHQVEILPSTDNNIQMKVDDQPINELDNGVLVPNDPKTWIIKVTKNSDHILVQMNKSPLFIVHGLNHIALGIHTSYRGKISGLCGHLDGSYLMNIRESYTTMDL